MCAAWRSSSSPICSRKTSSSSDRRFWAECWSKLRIKTHGSRPWPRERPIASPMFWCPDPQRYFIVNSQVIKCTFTIWRKYRKESLKTNIFHLYHSNRDSVHVKEYNFSNVLYVFVNSRRKNFSKLIWIRTFSFFHDSGDSRWKNNLFLISYIDRPKWTQNTILGTLSRPSCS